MTGQKRNMSVILTIEHLDLDQTLGCGQTFRWCRERSGVWHGPIGDCVVTLDNRREGLRAESTPHRADLPGRVSTYLRADDDIGRVHAAISRDEVLADGLHELKGLHLVKMDEWECVLSYVLATYANIPRIKGMIERLSSRYGDVIDGEAHAFPSLDQMRGATMSDLERCGLGYRARHVERLCRQLDEDVLGSMRRMKYEELRSSLLELPGVGDKVADCIALFGFGRLESFPIDVWIERALLRLYGVRGSYSKLRRFATDRFGEHAGYAQEYIYFNERVFASRGRCLFTRPDGSCGRTP